MTSHSEDTMRMCEKCGVMVYVEKWERHLEQWHKDDLRGGSTEVKPASESGGQT